MCGITGFISFGDKLSANDFYNAHLNTAHRGPDDEGFFSISNNESLFLRGDDTDKEHANLTHINDISDVELILGHRRLSIIDLSSDGHQPFKYGKYVVVYNGEIYNYLELRNELEDMGYEFLTATDTEVFLASYSMWGEAAFKKFNGMWAAVIYDTTSKEVIFTRDRFGIKPLYYILNDGGVYFSSEIKFFKTLNDLSEVNEQAIYQYLRYSETDYSEDTMFESVKQVFPGSYVKLSNGSLQKITYWDSADLHCYNGKDSIEDILKNSIDLRLRSDVKVGSLLSGGIDSSLIVGLINESIGLKQFNSYSAVFEEDKYSEKKYIEKTAQFLNFNPIYVYPKANDLEKYINELVYIQEQPFRSLSVLSQFLIYKEVAEKKEVKVLLNGQGADEIFSGYTEHYYIYFIDLLKRARIKCFVKEIIAFKKHKYLSWGVVLKNTFKSLISQSFERSNKYDLFNKKFIKKRAQRPFKSPLKNKLFSDLSFSALREYLRYEDINSMRFSLESRLPFLDFRLVKAAFSLSADEYIVDGITKIHLRNMGKNRLAKAVRERKDKTGFISPQESWQKNELRAEFDKCFASIEANGLFDFVNTNSLVLLYKDYVENKHNDWAIIWRIYCLYKWKEVWLLNPENCRKL